MALRCLLWATESSTHITDSLTGIRLHQLSHNFDQDPPRTDDLILVCEKDLHRQTRIAWTNRKLLFYRQRLWQTQHKFDDDFRLQLSQPWSHTTSWLGSHVSWHFILWLILLRIPRDERTQGTREHNSWAGAFSAVQSMRERKTEGNWILASFLRTISVLA